MGSRESTATAKALPAMIPHIMITQERIIRLTAPFHPTFLYRMPVSTQNTMLMIANINQPLN